jgi:hypothetical protein
VLAGVVVAGTLLGIGGCSYNASPLHTGLSNAEIDARVRERFWVGMSGDKTQAALRRAALRTRVGPIPPRDGARERDRGIRADIYAPGVRYTGPYANSPSESLYLWFTLDDRLEQIGHQRSRAAALPEGADTYALRVIPLAEEGDQ